MRKLSFQVAAALMLTSCTTASPPGIEVRTVEVPVEIQRPCPGTVPVRPAPLARPLPTDAQALAALLAAKLVEWADEGKYGDQAEAYVKACPPGD